MKKKNSTFLCQHCHAEYAKWQGQCTICKSWNTIRETTINVPMTPLRREVGSEFMSLTAAKQPMRLQQVVSTTQDKILCPDQEFNRVLGGGIVPGSLVLLGGEPGVGKSTLLLQVALTLPLKCIFYVSGEESEAQIKMRAARMRYQSEYLYILNTTSLSHIFKHIDQLKPELLIIDSIQTIYASHLDATVGSVAQVRDCTAALLHYAKSTHVPVLLIGHITKEGNLAGPKVLEHMVDTVLQFEGVHHLNYRIVRTIKNRFGTTAELGIYEMSLHGLREVRNPSELLLAQRGQSLSGVAIGATLEGYRPLLIELQTLVSPTKYGHAQRSTTGFDTKRLNMLLAVLERRVGFKLGMKDVFLNVAGGLRIEDPALDLAVCVALMSSVYDRVLSPDHCFAAEVGLGGEIRAVNRMAQRIIEAEKLGFKRIYVSKYNQQSSSGQNAKIQVVGLSSITEIVGALFKEATTNV